MMMKKTRLKRKCRRSFLAVTVCTSMVLSCFWGIEISQTETKAAESDAQEVTISANSTFASNDGVFEGWGTSLCWFGNRIGGSEKTTAEAAEYLCDKENGLGLNIIRFNIGGGDDPTHDHITRTDSKMPGYWGEYDEETDTFTYDYTKDENQRNVLLKMLDENPDLTLEAFSNSAPYFMTNSGCTSGSEKGGDNLKEDKYDDFAEYLVNVVKNYKELYGVNFTSIEAMNENGWCIERNGNKQEGCSFARGSSQPKMILALKQALEDGEMQDLILAGCDESSPAETIKSLDGMSEEALSALERIDTHTYSIGSMSKLCIKATELGKKLWMSEVDGGSAEGQNSGEMGAALYFAGKISSDLCKLQPSAWIMWQAIGSYCGKEPFAGNQDPESLDQKTLDTNGFWGVTYADMDQEKVVLTKKYYGFKQYTNYIHEGDLMLVGDKKDVVSYDEDAKELKIVAVNTKASEEERAFRFDGFAVEDGSMDMIRTSGDIETGENCVAVENTLKANKEGFTAELAPNSITTFVVKGVSQEDLDVPTVEPSSTPQITPEETPAADTNPTPTAVPVQSPVVDGSQTPLTGDSQNTVADNVKSPAKVKKVTLSRKNAKTIALSWEKVEEVDGYIVAYAKSAKKLKKLKDGSGKKTSGVLLKKTSKPSAKLTGLSKNRKYYVKVCAYKKRENTFVYGKYSSPKKK